MKELFICNDMERMWNEGEFEVGAQKLSGQNGVKVKVKVTVKVK
jgi:hypothetical protein